MAQAALRRVAVLQRLGQVARQVDVDGAAVGGVEQVATLVDAVNRAKPSGAKGVYMQSITLTTSMSPGVPIDVAVALAPSGARR